MNDLVGFYWNSGEVTLPIDAIPEGDRSPLRLRRSVAQTHVPLVVDQLKAGRFVAAVWPAGNHLSLILCHPNLAIAQADSFLVNPALLPRLNVKLDAWEEAPSAADLLLKAFGNEAATEADCAMARRDLATWLIGRSQPEMAAVVRHYSRFPFGVKEDALSVIDIWRDVLVKGEKDDIERFLAESQKRFEQLGWLKDEQREQAVNDHSLQWSRDKLRERAPNTIPHQINHLYCWVGPMQQIVLCLNATETRVRGGTYDALDRQATLVDVARAMRQVLGEVLEPAAASSGLKVTYPRLGPVSRIGWRTTEAMRTLAEKADGQWPLDGDAARAWREFVLAAHREEVAIKPEELTEWFIASGWSAPVAAEIAERFYAEASKFAEYEEEIMAWR